MAMNYIPMSMDVWLKSENDLLDIDPSPRTEDVDVDLMRAEEHVMSLLGSCFYQPHSPIKNNQFRQSVI